MTLINNYPAVYKPEHPRAYQNGMVYEHILKAEEKLKRQLLPKEVVHHIDHNRNNNSYENLIIFSTQEDHGRFHATDENKNYLIQNPNGSYSCPIENVKQLFKYQRAAYCPSCGRKNISHNIYCMDCIKKYHPYSKKPERDILKQLVRVLPFTTIGKQYNVTDGAVHKWCRSYNLPATKKEINKYTDEEWEGM